MENKELYPSVELLKEEYLLVQAWKKTVSYIRYHNWYADTLELDKASANLRGFLMDVSARFSDFRNWENDSLRMVPAPKSQEWCVDEVSGLWGPVNSKATASKIRPLAHVSLRDQVAATAILMCLADRVESRQGDSRKAAIELEDRKKLTSYGNRLFCDSVGKGRLSHRWGASKLYRSYFQDYRQFLLRPETVAERAKSEGTRIVLVHSDLKQFFDRVRPAAMAEKVRSLRSSQDDLDFFGLAEKILNWHWHPKDVQEVSGYANKSNIDDFSAIALPQGLVASGFFANAFLLDFDNLLRDSIGRDVRAGIQVLDVCRYVDDLRIVLSVKADESLSELEGVVALWLQNLLDSSAPGLKVSPEKTRAANLSGEQRPIVRQSRKMERIQQAVSGGFDAAGGEEILEAVQGLIRSQRRYSKESQSRQKAWELSPIPDVADATVARFAAGRFRTTFRSLRPLLQTSPTVEEDHEESSLEFARTTRTQADLDEEARSFALGLIENWVADPSNVRLLRIGLDLWPAREVLQKVLGLLRPFTKREGKRNAPRRVAWYCLSEILRAGATETGFVSDGESLPIGINVEAYRALLIEEAERLLSLPSKSLPWYLKQQALLLLAVQRSTTFQIDGAGKSAETAHYRSLIRFLRGDLSPSDPADFATHAVLARRSFLNKEEALNLVGRFITSRRLEELALRDPSFALEVLSSVPRGKILTVSPRLRDDLCLEYFNDANAANSLASTVLNGGPRNPLRNELGLLLFSKLFLAELKKRETQLAISPADVYLTFENGVLTEVAIRPSRVLPDKSMYLPPPWCSTEERWRFHLAYLLRFILAANPDFARPVRSSHWRESSHSYRPPYSHWYQRLYGMFNGRAEFGDDWLPISTWIEGFLYRLLSWPGCRSLLFPVAWRNIDTGLQEIETRLREVATEISALGDTLLLRVRVARPDSDRSDRALRACVVQTVLPSPSQDSDGDFPARASATLDSLQFNDPAFRKRHRNHLSAALSGVEKMVALRATHKGREEGLDLLIFPELSIHPEDVRSHLIPFARSHKTMIFAGLTYQELFAGEPLVNSALWIIPEWTNAFGLQVRVIRQGKQNLAPVEMVYNDPVQRLQGFRPCQWLVGYQWAVKKEESPMWLSGSICYDATDLSLTSELRNRSDVYVISALNKDVVTFDQMASALHYHMFQFVTVANNGYFGGSNAYAPYNESYRRQVFHLHGQPQASIGFFEISEPRHYLDRVSTAKAEVGGSKKSKVVKPRWKYPPAGM